MELEALNKAKARKYEGRTEFLSDRDKLVIKMWREKGKVIKFSVAYLRKYKNKWFAIKRCDNSHHDFRSQSYKYPHCHIYRYKGKQSREPMKGEPKELLTLTINDFKKRRKTLLENYFNKFSN